MPRTARTVADWSPRASWLKGTEFHRRPRWYARSGWWPLFPFQQLGHCDWPVTVAVLALLIPYDHRVAADVQCQPLGQLADSQRERDQPAIAGQEQHGDQQVVRQSPHRV